MTTPIEDAIAFTEKILAKFKEFEVPEDVAAYAKHRTILDALRFKQKAEKQEPVAWLKEWGGKGSAAAGIQVDLHPDNDAWMQRLSPTVIPLYTHPLPQPVAPDRAELIAELQDEHNEWEQDGNERIPELLRRVIAALSSPPDDRVSVPREQVLEAVGILNGLDPTRTAIFFGLAEQIAAHNLVKKLRAILIAAGEQK